MARGDKSGNPANKRHRAAGIAERMMRTGATRAESNRIATAAMDREYAGDRGALRGVSVDVDEHDSRTEQRKTDRTTKKGASVSGAGKPSAARKPATTKASSGRKPRTRRNVGTTDPGANDSAKGRRQPVPRKAVGAKHPNAGK